MPAQSALLKNKSVDDQKSMKVSSFYINLDSENQRKVFLEKNYQQFIGGDWPLTRVDAVVADSDTVRSLSGTLSLREKACFKSHLLAIEQGLDLPDDILILEDDALFGSYSKHLIVSGLALLRDQEWDLLFLDVAVPNPESMIDFFRLRQFLIAQARFNLVDLSKINFAGATAYIINANSKKKIYDELMSLKEINTPYDLQLRNLIHEEKLKGQVIFPFASTLSEFADSSQIQPQSTQRTDQAWNAYRRLVWVGCANEPYNPVVANEQLIQAVDDLYSKNLGAILAITLGKNFQEK